MAQNRVYKAVRKEIDICGKVTDIYLSIDKYMVVNVSLSGLIDSIKSGYTVENANVDISGKLILADKVIDSVVGKTFGELTVTGYSYMAQRGIMCKCRCSCGKDVEYSENSLKAHSTESCGHTRNLIKNDLTGKTFNEFRVLEFAGNKKWRCQCSCGEERLISGYDLTKNRYKSCGHERRDDGKLIGKVFGHLKVVSLIRTNTYKCECDCGKEVIATTNELSSNRKLSCGSNMHKHKDLSKEKFGLLTPIRYIGNYQWECKCDCGTVSNYFINSLRNGTDNCGCKTREKMKKTLIERYGDPNPNKVNNAREPWQIEVIESNERLGNYIKSLNYKPTPRELGSLVGLSLSPMLVIIHSFGLEEAVNMNPGYSKEESELREFIKGIYDGEIIQGDRKVLHGSEIDILLKDINIAIEFNGDYWHSSIMKDKNYHYEKTRKCKEAGIRLIHIFEYEWNDSNKKIKLCNMLSDIIGKQQIIYARNTNVCEIESTEAEKFLDTYHLQGSANAPIRVALKSNDTIVGLMTFGKPRFDGSSQYELVRLAFKSGYSVVGGAERMFKYFIEKYNPKSILSYCDISKFSGEVYNKLKFKCKEQTRPGYVWVEPGTHKVMTRYMTQKHKLLESGIGTIEQTEDEIMMNAGYLKIYDCGNLKFIWNREQSN